MKFRKILSLGLAAAMALSVTACGPAASSSSNATTPAGNDATTADNNQTPSGEKRIIRMGTWWDTYYDSSNDSVESDPSYDGNPVSEMRFENVAKIEKKYNCEFYWTNLTYEGTIESINNSILAGTPDCDVYLVEAGMGIPAAVNGLVTDLKTILPEDADILTEQKYMSFLDLGDGTAHLFYPVSAEAQVTATWPLAFNKEMLDNAGLEDPRDLYARDEWTWDKFLEYCKALTKDTNGDGENDQFGYVGFAKETLENLCFSNGTSITKVDANGKWVENITSSEVTEVLNFISKMYLEDKVCFPYDDAEGGSPWESMRLKAAKTNTVGFWPCANWVAGNENFYPADGTEGVPFTMCFVQWPVGPSGDKATNAGKNSFKDTFYIIPKGVKDPVTVYNMMCDYFNWYDGDIELRDDKEALKWWYEANAATEELQVKNFDCMNAIGAKTTPDPWDSIQVEMDLTGFVMGRVTVSELQETNKLVYQDALDNLLN